MKIHQILSKTFAILYFFILGLSSCQKQEPNLILTEQTFNQQAVISKTYTDTFSTKMADKTVPLILTWDTYLDSTERCLKIAGFKLRRIGGPSDIIISKIEGNYSGICASDFGTANEDDFRFTELSVYGRCETYSGIQRQQWLITNIHVHSNGKVNRLENK